jgi:hypothetical protein
MKYYFILHEVLLHAANPEPLPLPTPLSHAHRQHGRISSFVAIGPQPPSPPSSPLSRLLVGSEPRMAWTRQSEKHGRTQHIITSYRQAPTLNTDVKEVKVVVQLILKMAPNNIKSSHSVHLFRLNLQANASELSEQSHFVDNLLLFGLDGVTSRLVKMRVSSSLKRGMSTKLLGLVVVSIYFPSFLSEINLQRQ